MNPFPSILTTLRAHSLNRDAEMLETWLTEFHQNASPGYVSNGSPGHSVSDPVRSHPDYFHAVSNKYTDRVFMILPLPSGDFALFNAARHLVTIVPAATSIAEVSERNVPVPARQVGRVTGRSNLTPPDRGPAVDFEL